MKKFNNESERDMFSIINAEWSRKVRKEPSIKNEMTFKEFYIERKKFHEEELKNRLLQDKKMFEKWKGVSTPKTIFERIDTDIVFASAIDSRKDSDGEYTGTMSKQWGIGKPKGPKFRS